MFVSFISMDIFHIRKLVTAQTLHSLLAKVVKHGTDPIIKIYIQQQHKVDRHFDEKHIVQRKHEFIFIGIFCSRDLSWLCLHHRR